MALTVWNGLEAGQHLLTDRDPGVYVTTARWLAAEGTLLVDPAVGPFAGRDDLGFEEQGWNLDDDGRLEPQFLHLLPVVLAAAQLVGGDRALLLAPAAIAGAALLAFHLFASRLLRPWWALVATGALAVDLVWVHLSRDAFSEVSAVLLLFSGLAVLWDARTRGSAPRAFAAGLLLGGVATARVEGFVLLLPLLVAVAVELLAAQAAPAAERRTAHRTMAGLVLGTAVTVAVAVADLLLFSTWYLDDLQGLLLAVAVGVLLVVVGGAAAVAVAAADRRRAGPGRRRDCGPAPGARRVLAAVAAAGVVVLAALLWVVRPLVSTVTGSASVAIAALEQQEGRAPEGLRRYSEHSVEWLSWYIGPVALVAGIAGLALLVHRLVRARRPDLRPLPFLLVFGAVSLLYLWRPSIVPDQIWAMRRYATVTIPGLLLLAALAGQVVEDRLVAAGRTSLGPVVAGALGVAMIGFPLSTLAPVAGMTTQEGLLGKVSEVCEAVGEDGALVVLPGGALELVTGQAFRSFCGVPVAIAGEAFGEQDAAALAAAWAAEGRDLHLVGADAASVEALSGSAPELTVVVPNDQVLEATLTSRPDELDARPVTFVVGAVGG